MVLSPDSVERLITSRTSGIIGVHLFGTPCDTDALAALAARRGLRLVYDATHAFGCAHRGRMIGSFGDAEVFNFHATKAVHAGEGGAVVTNSDELAAAISLTVLESAPEIFAANRRNYGRSPARKGLC